MQTKHQVLVAGLAAAMTLTAAGKQNPTPPNTAEIRIFSETVPAGGTVQVKFSFTEPHPIMSTGAGYAMEGMTLDGVAVWSPLGDAGGVGVLKNGSLYVAAASPSGSLGTGVDYPFLTVTSDVPAGLKTGASLPLNWTPDAWLFAATGPMNLQVKPGTLTIGGSISIHGVYPGGGTWPAGTLVKILGSGFNSRTRVNTKFKTTSVSIVSANEIHLILKEKTRLTGQEVTAENTDNSAATYYAYSRAVLVRPPARDLLKVSEPAFPEQTHAVASVTVPELNTTQFAALALQNSEPGPLVVTFELHGESGPSQVTSVVLPSGTRVVDDLSSLLNGAVVNPGDTVRVTSTAPVQMLGLLGDESAVTVTPFFPTF